METTEKDEPTVHRHQGDGSKAWYVTRCGYKGTDIYVTLNDLFVTCDKCKTPRSEVNDVGSDQEEATAS